MNNDARGWTNVGTEHGTLDLFRRNDPLGWHRTICWSSPLGTITTCEETIKGPATANPFPPVLSARLSTQGLSCLRSHCYLLLLGVPSGLLKDNTHQQRWHLFGPNVRALFRVFASTHCQRWWNWIYGAYCLRVWIVLRTYRYSPSTPGN